MGAVSPVDGLDKSTILSVSAVLEISWPGGHLDLASDDDVNVDVAGRARDSGRLLEHVDDRGSPSMIQSRCSDGFATALKSCAIQVSRWLSGPSLGKFDGIEMSDIRYEFRVGDPSSCPGRRGQALLSARTILRLAVLAVVT